MGTFGRRPFKFDSEDKVRIDISVDIPRDEYDLLVSYAAGDSMKRISQETGRDFKTVAPTLRKNIKLLLGK